AALVLMPLAAGVLWTQYADGLKEQNALARHLTSRALQEWNFGTWGQRGQAETWGCILGRTPAMAHASIFLAVSGALALLARRYVGAVLSGALIYLALPLVFTNLYFMHEYYSYASMVFLVGAVGLTAAGLAERGGIWAGLGGLLAAAFVAVAGVDYFQE